MRGFAGALTLAFAGCFVASAGVFFVAADFIAVADDFFVWLFFAALGAACFFFTVAIVRYAVFLG